MLTVPPEENQGLQDVEGLFETQRDFLLGCSLVLLEFGILILPKSRQPSMLSTSFLFPLMQPQTSFSLSLILKLPFPGFSIPARDLGINGCFLMTLILLFCSSKKFLSSTLLEKETPLLILLQNMELIKSLCSLPVGSLSLFSSAVFMACPSPHMKLVWIFCFFLLPHLMS
ncbi:Uncharacterized protein TCM_031684 [Theobroma cacao]|uniref:Uncharacterized protein n=1 Tax=Theobroma cacao TaxID=3641 RepID=A0A061FFE7_THECC|nr:Uncharacterized protein TCM_031684 [Theobroma cacao]